MSVHATPSAKTPRAPGAARASGAAPISRAILAQTRAELTMTLRRGETLLITLIVPALLLLFFASLNIVPTRGKQKPIDFLLPGMLALAVMSTGMVSLGIATAYERHYGVLKRLGSSPLPRWGLVVAKVLSVLMVEAGQVALLVGLAVVGYGWRPHGSLFAALLVLLLGTLAFASLGMYLAGALRAEATLAGANGLYLFFLIFGGSVLPLDHLPGVLRGPLSLLPAAALSDGLRGALGVGGAQGGSVLRLAAWGIILLAAAALTFRWE
ncbi:MAG: ABC transporter permease [Ktedonobacterales bacterium]|nr:ABC transporter permease [Ktedonobacterales bacterium]